MGGITHSQPETGQSPVSNQLQAQQPMQQPAPQAPATPQFAPTAFAAPKQGFGFDLSNLAGLFGGSQGYSQPVQTPQIQQPQYPAALTPTPEDAAAATRARMQARTPMAAPAAAPVNELPRRQPRWMGHR